MNNIVSVIVFVIVFVIVWYYVVWSEGKIIMNNLASLEDTQGKTFHTKTDEFTEKFKILEIFLEMYLFQGEAGADI